MLTTGAIIAERISTTPEVEALIAADAPVAIGVSGGKDSCAAAFATVDYLEAVGHRGPQVLVHSDLGRVEWKDSLPTCQRLADRLDRELIVLRRSAGDMMDRWQARWASSVERYRSLSCVKLILPWSTPSMRFCTSELKTDVITRDLVRRFPGSTILSVSGIRADESSQRSKAPIFKPQAKLTSAKYATRGLDWHPILGWSRDDVFAYMALKGFDPHEAYPRYGSSRVSCCYCIMSTLADLIAAASCPDNHDIYREMVALEIASTFAFQGDRWLGDVAPDLLGPEMMAGLAAAKQAAARRVEIESRIPPHLLYTAGWPTCMPTEAEARMLAEVRLDVAGAVGLAVDFTTPESILARYHDLMVQAASKRKGN